MTIKKLEVVEFTEKEERTFTYKPGYKYTHFLDPLTGKYYRPIEGFTVEGENLEDRFVELKSQKELWNINEVKNTQENLNDV